MDCTYYELHQVQLKLLGDNSLINKGFMIVSKINTQKVNDAMIYNSIIQKVNDAIIYYKIMIPEYHNSKKQNEIKNKICRGIHGRYVHYVDDKRKRAHIFTDERSISLVIENMKKIEERYNKKIERESLLKRKRDDMMDDDPIILPKRRKNVTMLFELQNEFDRMNLT